MTIKLGDACEAHYPGDYPAVQPYKVTEERSDRSHASSIRGEYACWCGHRWTCWWDPGAVGWPMRCDAYPSDRP